MFYYMYVLIFTYWVLFIHSNSKYVQTKKYSVRPSLPKCTQGKGNDPL